MHLSLTSFFRAATSSSRLSSRHSRASTRETASKRSSNFSSKVSLPSVRVGCDGPGRSTSRVVGAGDASSNVNGSSLSSCRGFSVERTQSLITSALYVFFDFPQATTTFFPTAIVPFFTAFFFTHEVVPFDRPSLHLTRIFSISADLTDSQTNELEGSN